MELSLVPESGPSIDCRRLAKPPEEMTGSAQADAFFDRYVGRGRRVGKVSGLGGTQGLSLVSAC
jgi:hypothetical protein